MNVEERTLRDPERGYVVRCPRCGGTDGHWWFEDPVIGKRHWDHTCPDGARRDEEI